MSDLIDMLYRLRDMAGKSADKLRAEVQAGQAVLDRLDAFADECEKGAELLASSNLYPKMSALIPKESGLAKVVEMPTCIYCADNPCTCPQAEEPEDKE